MGRDFRFKTISGSLMLNSQLSTPSHSRMAKISEKLNGMNLKFDQERVYKLDQ